MSRTTHVYERLTSAVGNQVNGTPFRMGGHRASVQIREPAAVTLGRFEISNDGVEWEVGTHEVTVDMTALGDGVYQVFQGAEWGRHVVLTDAGGPREFEYTTTIYVEE